MDSHPLAHPVHPLVGKGPLDAHRLGCPRHLVEQFAFRAYLGRRGGLRDAKGDRARVGAGGDLEVVVEPSLLPVVDNVDARIDLLGPHGLVARQLRAPG